MNRRRLSVIRFFGMVLCISLWIGITSALTAPVKIGNPGLEQFPNDSSADCFARSVWDMHCYNGSIYVGVGDYWSNRGPIDVWSFDASDVFVNEYTVDEEQIWHFREYDGRLLIPGMDTTGTQYGNFYVKDHGTWQKIGTIPNAFHVWDVALYEGNVYVIITSGSYSELLESSDMGQTWRSIERIYWDDSAAGFSTMIVQNSSLLIIGYAPSGESCVYRYIGGVMEMSVIPDSVPSRRFTRAVRYRDGVLCIGDLIQYYLESPSPLVFLSDFGNTAEEIADFRQKNVRDILVRNNTCFVLTASGSNGAYQASIYSSPDLSSWTKLTEFSVSALPYSFELLDGSFYIGLGNRSKWDGYADVESGNIYKLDLNIPLLVEETLPLAEEDPQLADLELKMAARRSVGNEGDTLTYHIKLDNNGPDSATNVEITDELPSGVTYISSTLSQGSYDSSTGVWRVGNLKVHGKTRKASMYITVILNAAVDSPVIINRAYVKHLDQIDPYVDNNEASIEVIRKVDLTKLNQNYPNPFNPETWIPYHLSEAADVTVTIYNMTGQVVRRLELGNRMPGSYVERSRAAYWDGTNEAGDKVSSGIYFYQLQTGQDASVRKMIIAE